jgi:hypothetical protein
MSELTTTTGGGLMSTEVFDQVVRQAKAWSSSTMVPKEYQGATGMGNCIVAIELASRMQLSPFEVMQNLYIVHGRPTWKAEFVISRLVKKYTEIEFEKDDNDGGRCRVVATRNDGKRIEGTWVSMKMAKAEGWTSRTGTKWATMPEQMIMYRAATFFARVHAPEVLNGVADEHEPIDVGYERASSEVQKINDAMAAAPAPAMVDDDVIDDEPVADDAPVADDDDDNVI